MQYQIRFTKRASKELKKLPKDIQKRIVDRIEDLENELGGDVRRLTDHDPHFRLRVGDYRVLFDTEDSIVTIYRVVNRREAY